MRINRAFVLLFLGLAASADAQRGIMGGRGAMTPGRGPGSLSRDAGIYIPKYANAVNLLLEHRPELALSDSQFTRVIAMKRILDSTNAPLLRKLDSVQRLFRAGTPLFSSPSAARRDSLVDARSLVIETTGTVRDNIAAAREKAYALLSSTQLKKAQEFEEKAERAALAENQKGERASGTGAGVFGRPPTS